MCSFVVAAAMEGGGGGGGGEVKPIPFFYRKEERGGVWMMAMGMRMGGGVWGRLWYFPVGAYQYLV